MHFSNEHEELENFFRDRSLPSGPQHINEYSVFLNLPGAVTTQLQWLHSEVAATRKSAAVMLQEVRDWLLQQAGSDQLPN
ncbi:DUF6965 family protein [Spirosoma pulveris]